MKHLRNLAVGLVTAAVVSGGVVVPAQAAGSQGTFTTGRGDRAITWQYATATWPARVPYRGKMVNGWATFVSLVPITKGKKAVPPYAYQIDAWNEQAKGVFNIHRNYNSKGAEKWQIARLIPVVRPHDIVHVRWMVFPVQDETVNPIRNLIMNNKHKVVNLKPTHLKRRPAGL